MIITVPIFGTTANCAIEARAVNIDVFDDKLMDLPLPATSVVVPHGRARHHVAYRAIVTC